MYANFGPHPHPWTEKDGEEKWREEEIEKERGSDGGMERMGGKMKEMWKLEGRKWEFDSSFWTCRFRVLCQYFFYRFFYLPLLLFFGFSFFTFLLFLPITSSIFPFSFLWLLCHFLSFLLSLVPSVFPSHSLSLFPVHACLSPHVPVFCSHFFIPYWTEDLFWKPLFLFVQAVVLQSFRSFVSRNILIYGTKRCREKNTLLHSFVFSGLSVNWKLCVLASSSHNASRLGYLTQRESIEKIPYTFSSVNEENSHQCFRFLLRGSNILCAIKKSIDDFFFFFQFIFSGQFVGGDSSAIHTPGGEYVLLFFIFYVLTCFTCWLMVMIVLFPCVVVAFLFVFVVVFGFVTAWKGGQN